MAGSEACQHEWLPSRKRPWDYCPKCRATRPRPPAVSTPPVAAPEPSSPSTSAPPTAEPTPETTVEPIPEPTPELPTSIDQPASAPTALPVASSWPQFGPPPTALPTPSAPAPVATSWPELGPVPTVTRPTASPPPGASPSRSVFAPAAATVASTDVGAEYSAPAHVTAPPAPPVTPRITRPEPFAAPIVVESDPATPRHIDIRAVAIALGIIGLSVLIGLLVAGLMQGTSEGRGGRSTGTAATSTSAIGGSSPLASVAPAGSLAPEGGVAPASTLAPLTGLELVPPVVTLGKRLTSDGIELRIAWAPPADGTRTSRYDLQVSQDGGAYRTVDLARKNSLSATSSADANHDRSFRLRARGADGTRGPYATSAVRVTRHEETSPDIRASKGWKIAKHPDYTGAGAQTSTTKGAELSLAFEGTAVGIVGPSGPGRGRAEVFVDGERVGRFDEKADAFRPVSLLFAIDGLAAGPHVMSVRVLGTSGRPMVGIDRFLVLEQP